MASTEIKNIDSHSHAGLHRSSIRFSPARQYLFFPRTVRGTNCSCIPRALSLNPSTLAAQESQTQRLFFIWFFLPLLAQPQPLPHIHIRTPSVVASRFYHHPTPSYTVATRINDSSFLPTFLLCSSLYMCVRAHVCVYFLYVCP